MDQLLSLALLDPVARDELAATLERMAGDTRELAIHAHLPFSFDMLDRREVILRNAAIELRGH